MPDTKHLVITVHGIRTYGDWQDELKKLLEAAEPGVTVRLYRYGVFSSFAFLIPPLRWLVGRQFRNFFVQEVRSAAEGARIDLVAHSFGTYLAAWAIRCLPEGRRIHTVIFAGSVLRPSFHWYKYLQAGCVGRVINECGWDDSVLVLCQSTALLMGMAGRIGFHGMVGDRFINRYYRWGHGGYFDHHQQFMREQWVPLLTGDGPVPPHDERPPLTAVGGARLFLLSNMQFIKLSVACLLLITAVVFPIDWWRKAQFKKRTERINHIALLANAQEIPGRDPTHVRDLLEIDAKASGDEKAIDHLIGSQGTSDALDSELPDEEAEPRWWESLPGMADRSREAYRARLAHYKANLELVASNNGTLANNQAKAQSHFETALSSYKKINDRDPVYGSYALCLIDYGRLLYDMGQHESAIKQFQKVRTEVFPSEATGPVSKQPASLAVDSLIFESRSHKLLEHWEDAAKLLEDAVRIAKNQGESALMCDAHDELAWLHIDQLEVDDAVKDFAAAEDACRKIMRDHIEYKIRLFHIRHGRALADRLKGNAPEAYDQYQQIVTDLQKLTRTDLTFTPKQRRDLHERLYNSMERRADVFFFRRHDAAAPATATDRAQLTSASRAPAAPNSGEPSQVENDYQEAIEVVGNGFLDIKTRLLYKKVIARFVDELENEQPMPAATRGARHKVLGTTDLEIAEANRTWDNLPNSQKSDLDLYRAIAKACMGLRECAMPRDEYFTAGTPVEASTGRRRAVAAPPEVCFSPQAVEKLRSLTRDNASKSAKFTREKAELLLLAHEILLKPGIEIDSDKRADDALRMLAVVAETTNVASHTELKKYFDRFQKIAAEQRTTMAGNGDNRTREPDQRSVVLKPVYTSPETLLFYLRLGPRLVVRLTSDAIEPGPLAAPPSINILPAPESQALSKTP